MRNNYLVDYEFESDFEESISYITESGELRYSSIPGFGLYCYYSKKDLGVSVVNKQNSEFIISFKEGNLEALNKAIMEMTQAIEKLAVLIEQFDDTGYPNQFDYFRINTDNTILMCIPASDPLISKKRFSRFINAVSDNLKISNGFSGIETIKHEPNKGKRLQNKISHFIFHPKVYTGKNVFLFDDISTTHETFTQTASYLLKTGAKTVTGFFLGITI